MFTLSGTGTETGTETKTRIMEDNRNQPSTGLDVASTQFHATQLFPFSCPCLDYRQCECAMMQGQEPGPIVSCCASPVSCTCPGPIPLQCE